MFRWLFVSLMVLLLDQASKQFAEALLSLHRPLHLLPFFDLTLMYNEGAAFSFLGEQGGWQRWFFILLALGVTGVLIGWLRRLQAQERWTALALSLIIGGALGNVSDRIWFGKVIDFLDLYYRAGSCLPGFYRLGVNCHWPAFNLADSAITVGVVILLLNGLFQSQGKRAD